MTAIVINKGDKGLLIQAFKNLKLSEASMYAGFTHIVSHQYRVRLRNLTTAEAFSLGVEFQRLWITKHSPL